MIKGNCNNAQACNPRLWVKNSDKLAVLKRDFQGEGPFNSFVILFLLLVAFQRSHKSREEILWQNLLFGKKLFFILGARKSFHLTPTHVPAPK